MKLQRTPSHVSKTRSKRAKLLFIMSRLEPVNGKRPQRKHPARGNERAQDLISGFVFTRQQTKARFLPLSTSALGVD